MLLKPLKRQFVLLISGVVLVGLLNTSIQAQDKSKKKEIPTPVRLALKTSDNVNLICTYFAGTNEKETVPIILLHDLEENREVFVPFANYLQRTFGHAVIIPDLRGHGESKKTVTNQDIDIKKFRKDDYATFNEDIACCFRYLRDEVNNKGQANIDSLMIVASGSMCINAAAWTLVDYAYPPLNGKKQGQFVKGLVMLSPRKSVKGFSLVQLIKMPLFSGRGVAPMPLMIGIGGSDKKLLADGRSIYKTLSRTHPKVDDVADREKKLKLQTLFFVEFKNASGSGILRPENKTGFEKSIAQFIKYKIEANSDDHPWVDYKKEE